MTVDLKRYRENLEQPWGKIQYEITFEQLAHLKEQDITDVSSVFHSIINLLSNRFSTDFIRSLG